MTGAVDLSCWVIMAGGWNGSGFWRIGGIWADSGLRGCLDWYQKVLVFLVA
jgi:hypothetical protein